MKNVFLSTYNFNDSNVSILFYLQICLHHKFMPVGFYVEFANNTTKSDDFTNNRIIVIERPIVISDRI